MRQASATPKAGTARLRSVTINNEVMRPASLRSPTLTGYGGRVVAMLKCPNCGAPLQGSGAEARPTCSYCGALLELPKPVVVPPPVHAPYVQYVSQTQAQRAPWLAIGVVAVAAVIAGVSGLIAFTSAGPATNAGAVRNPTGQAAPTPTAQPGIAWKRLDDIDIRASVDKAKTTLPKLFPEAQIQQDKDYTLALDHPILASARFSWTWGCACLESAAFDVKDYNTRTRTLSSFEPCLERGLGPVSKSAPPFDYEWAEKGGVPRVHFGPSSVLLFIERKTTQEGYRKVLHALDSCRN